jgi:pyridinium-3,5-bisthiocarboxylic acid mononucleotide nickel chelatase
MSIAYLDLPSGISGDMFLGCLVDAGWSIEQLRATLTKLKLPSDDWSVDAREVMKGPLRAKLVDVRVTEGAPIQHKFVLTQSPDHSHRNLHDVRKIIESSELSPQVKSKSIAVFLRLANAEAKVHGTTVENIHFHEVGALDAIVDIVGTVSGLHELGIEKLYASALPMGPGWTNSQHGEIPLPAPATLELLAAAGAPTCCAPGPGELVTPTGVALVCELAKFEQPPMRLQKIAIGAGKRDTAWPNAARLWVGTEETATSDSSRDSIVQIETNIDDMNPQFYGPLMERLLAAGALDAWATPIQMKKNRPAITLGVLSPASKQREMADIILRETTTLGVRIHAVQRFEAEREIQSITTAYGIVQVKLKKWGGKVIGAMPEYEDCRRLAEAKNVSLRTVYESSLAAAHEAFLTK